MIPTHRILALLALCSMFLIPQGAQAQESAETVRLNEEASEAFQAGKYEKAAAKFTEAAQKSSTKRSSAVLIKNAMISWFKVPNYTKCTEAVSSARLFLGYTQVATLSESDITDAKTVIVKCRGQEAQAALAAGDLPKAEAAIKDVKTYTANPENSTELKLLNDSYATKKKAAEDAERARLHKEFKGNQKDSNVGTIVGGSLMGIGVAGAVVTFLFSDPDLEQFEDSKVGQDFNYSEESGQMDSCEGQLAQDRPRCEKLQEDINDEIASANTAKLIGYSLSGAAFVGGAALLIIDLASKGESDPNALKLYPVLGVGQAGAALQFRF